MALHVRHASGIVGPGVQGSLRKSSARDQGPAAGERKIQRDCTLWMSSSVVFRDAVSKTLGAPAERAQLGERRRGGTSAPVCLFGGLFGGNRKASSKVLPPPEFKYHDDVPLPFPTSLISNTFLAGNLIATMRLPGKELRCCYKATLDGFGAMAFHKRCDFKGPCVVVGTTVCGVRMGAFNPEGYRSTDDYYDSFDAFLFYWPSAAKDAEAFPPSNPIVLPKVGGSGAALFDYARGGPQFGADGLLIGPPRSPVMGGLSGPETDSDQGQGQLSEARSRLGLSYAKRPDGKESVFGDDKKAILVEIEIFCSPAIASLYQ